VTSVVSGINKAIHLQLHKEEVIINKPGISVSKSRLWESGTCMHLYNIPIFECFKEIPTLSGSE